MSVQYQEEQIPCEICGSENFKHIRTKTGFGQEKSIKSDDKLFNATDVMCMGCGLIKKHPSLTAESLDLFYIQEYLQLYSPSLILGIPKGEIMYRVIDNIYFMEWIKKEKIILDGQSILNVGSGIGVLSYFLRSYGGLVDSIEPLERAREISQKLFGITPDERFIEKFDTDKKYDIIVFQNSLEHFHSPKLVLEKVRGFLKNNGSIIVEIPDLFYPYPKSTVDSWLSSAHMFSYSLDVLWKLIGLCGFEITHCSHDGDKKKLLIRAVPGTMTLRNINNPEDDYKKVFSMFKEMDSFPTNCDVYRKELLSGKDVKVISSNIYNNTQYYTNVYAIMLAEIMLNSSRPDIAKQILENCPYKESASTDIGVNVGSFLYFLSMIKRIEGDFTSFKRLNDLSIENFIPIEKYNIIKEMQMNAMISDSVLRPHFFWNAYQAKKQYQ